MSILKRAKALGFPSAFEMVKATGYSNSTLSDLMKNNPDKFEVVTLSARIGQLTIEKLHAMTGGGQKRIASKRLCDMTSEELLTIFGEAV